jgi:hypothetical protein
LVLTGCFDEILQLFSEEGICGVFLHDLFLGTFEDVFLVGLDPFLGEGEDLAAALQVEGFESGGGTCVFLVGEGELEKFMALHWLAKYCK